MQLPEEYLKRMEARLGGDFGRYLAAMEEPPVRGLRVNPLKVTAEKFCDIAPFALGGRVPWEENGFYHAEERAGADPYHFAGLYYLQEPSAMTAAPALGVERGERVLDLCAAPGGKATRLAADLAGEGILIANEVDPSRAQALSQNIERLGVTNCAVVSAEPARLAEQFAGYFDKILVDAPCSGEGMFRKDPAAAVHWNEQNVRACAARQRHILECAERMLAPRGTLVYSTCTFSDEETRLQTEALARDGLRPEGERFYYPHEIRGEGHFVARFRGGDGEGARMKPYPIRRNLMANRAFEAFAAELFPSLTVGEITTLDDGRMYAVPGGMPAFRARTLRLGTELGEWDGKRFKPAHALAMAHGGEARNKLDLGREEAKRYLLGEQLEADGEGWCVVCVDGFPLGWGKAAHGAVKNHLPKGLRLFTR